MTAPIQRRLEALEALQKQEEADRVLVVFEPMTEEQRQGAQEAEAAGALVVRVVFG